MEELKLDLRGQVCPSTLLQTLKAINKNKKKLKNKSLIIKVLTDNRDALTTIPEAVEKMGFSVISKKENSYYIILIKKNDGEYFF